MAVYKQGILGPFSGKVGTVVGASWRGMPYIRSLATKVANPKTPAQLDVRNRLSETSKALRPFIDTIRHGFVAAGVAAGWPQAVKVNRELTLKGDDDLYHLKPEDIILSQGAADFQASASYASGSLSLEWSSPSSTDELYDARVYLAVFNEANSKAVNFSADISAGEVAIGVNAILTGTQQDALHLYYFAATSELSSVSVHQKLS